MTVRMISKIITRMAKQKMAARPDFCRIPIWSVESTQRGKAMTIDASDRVRIVSPQKGLGEIVRLGQVHTDKIREVVDHGTVF